MIRPAAAPCVSCPYRRDVPSGIWNEDEYAKLPDYDKPTGEQPMGVFLCHTQQDHICAGWAGTHDMDECLALRIAASTGRLDMDEALATRDYETSVPLFATGQEAADHGRAQLAEPSEEARAVIHRLLRRRME